MSEAARCHISISSGAPPAARRPRAAGAPLGGLPQVPLRHEVRVDVVVDDGGVLVGAGHPVDAEAVLGVEVAQRGPQPGGLDQQLGAEVAVELLVQGGVVVPDDGVGDVGVDVEGRRPRRPVARRLLAVDRAPREGRSAHAQLRGPRPGHLQGRVPPAQRVPGRARRGVGEHRQDVGLGVPERVAVVAGAGEALGRDRLALTAKTGLQDVEHADPHGLLHLVVALDLDVGLVPVLVEQLPLLTDEPVPAGQLGGGERGLHLVAEGGARAAGRPAVGDELGQFERRRRAGSSPPTCTGRGRRWPRCPRCRCRGPRSRGPCPRRSRSRLRLVRWTRTARRPRATASFALQGVGKRGGGPRVAALLHRRRPWPAGPLQAT